MHEGLRRRRPIIVVCDHRLKRSQQRHCSAQRCFVLTCGSAQSCSCPHATRTPFNGHIRQSPRARSGAASTRHWHCQAITVAETISMALRRHMVHRNMTGLHIRVDPFAASGCVADASASPSMTIIIWTALHLTLANRVVPCERATCAAETASQKLPRGSATV